MAAYCWLMAACGRTGTRRSCVDGQPQSIGIHGLLTEIEGIRARLVQPGTFVAHAQRVKGKDDLDTLLLARLKGHPNEAEQPPIGPHMD